MCESNFLVVARNDDFVLARDIAAGAERVNADLGILTRCLSLAAVRALGEVPVGLDLLEQPIRGATRRVALVVVMGLDEFHVVAGQVPDRLTDDVDQRLLPRGEVRRVEDGDILARRLERLVLLVVEPGRAGDERDARVGACRGVASGRLGAGEVDHGGRFALATSESNSAADSMVIPSTVASPPAPD